MYCDWLLSGFRVLWDKGVAGDFHEHGTPWRRTGVDHGEWLVEMAEVRERQDEPA